MRPATRRADRRGKPLLGDGTPIGLIGFPKPDPRDQTGRQQSDPDPDSRAGEGVEWAQDQHSQADCSEREPRRDGAAPRRPERCRARPGCRTGRAQPGPQGLDAALQQLEAPRVVVGECTRGQQPQSLVQTFPLRRELMALSQEREEIEIGVHRERGHGIGFAVGCGVAAERLSACARSLLGRHRVLSREFQPPLQFGELLCTSAPGIEQPVIDRLAEVGAAPSRAAPAERVVRSLALASPPDEVLLELFEPLDLFAIEIRQRPGQLGQIALPLLVIVAHAAQGDRSLVVGEAEPRAPGLGGTGFQGFEFLLAPLDLDLAQLGLADFRFGRADGSALLVSDARWQRLFEVALDCVEVEATRHLSPDLAREISARAIRIIEQIAQAEEETGIEALTG